MRREVRRRAAPWLGLQAVLAACAAASVPADKVRLECSPREFQVVPGEPIRLEVTVRADSAAPIHLHVPDDPMLKLRALEKMPVRRTAEGDIVHRRAVVWQGLQPGTVRLTTLSVETGGRKLPLPEITITVLDPGP